MARQTLWREARIEGSCILIDCAPEEFEQHHLDSLKEDVKYTNKTFGLLMAQRQEEATRQLQAEQTARKRLQDLQNTDSSCEFSRETENCVKLVG